jgi:iron complex outermembrane receptor protein|nr:TonB-dependent siderophore receptor [Methylobacterium sp. 2A]
MACGSGAALGQSSVTLEELQVFGSRSDPSPQSPESPTGPGNGYVAARSLVGTKTDTPVLEAPQSVSVVTKQQIQRQGSQAVSQALSYSAGVQNEPFGHDARYDVFIIRGFAASQFGNYKDGLRQGNGVYAYFRNDPYETERIEVLRGPTSVLFGANDPGGLVNLVSKVPTAQPFHETGPDIGNYGRRQGRFDVSGPVAGADGVLYRLTGLVRQSGTQIAWTPDDRISLAPALTVRLGDATTLTLLGEVARNHTAMWPFVYSGPSGKVTRIGLSDPNFDRLDQSQYQFGYRLESRPGDDIVFRQSFRVGGVDFRGNLVDGMGLASNGYTLNRYAEQIRENLSVVTVDNNVQAGFKTGPLIHTGLIGLDYFQQDTAKRELYGMAPALDLRNPINAPYPYALSQMGSLTGQSLQQVGLYGQDQIALGRFRLTAGVRQDFASLNTLDRITLGEAQATPSALTERVGLTYLFDNGVAPYATYATSFLPQGGTQSPRRGSTPFEPSEGENYEIGVKYQPGGMNALFTTALYELTKSNVLTPDPQDPRYFVQTGAITVKGAEFEGVFSLGDGFSGIASYAHTDARVTKSNGADRGKVPVGVPLEQAGIFLDYTVPTGELAGLGGGAGLRYTGRTKANPINTQTNPTLTAIDLSLHYEISAVRFAVTARNVADQRRGICSSGFCRMSLGRTLLASVSVQW